MGKVIVSAKIENLNDLFEVSHGAGRGHVRTDSDRHPFHFGR